MRFEMQEEEYSYSDFTDKQLCDILALCGPKIKDMLLLPGPVGVRNDHRILGRAERFYRQAWYKMGRCVRALRRITKRAS